MTQQVRPLLLLIFLILFFFGGAGPVPISLSLFLGVTLTLFAKRSWGDTLGFRSGVDGETEKFTLAFP